MTYGNTHSPEVTSKTRAPGHPVRYLVDVRGLDRLDAAERERLSIVSRRYAFRTNDYYMRLVDWADPADPIRRLVVPSFEELVDFGALDPSDEASNTKLTGLQHKYTDTALLLVTDQCGGFCRYCFRKRLFVPGSRETHRSLQAGLEYIGSHPEITDVLLTGGDPLTLSTRRIAEIVGALRRIPHLRAIRIGSKMLAFNPYRVLDDPDLVGVLRSDPFDGVRVHLMCHFDHPRELTAAAVEAIGQLTEAGVVCANQCPITTGVNDSAEVLAELFQACTDAGCPQYYVFQCRPTVGNASFQMPVTRAFELLAEARAKVSGLSRRARLCMSHTSGKIEVVGLDDERIYARYHRAKNPADEGRMLVLRRDDTAGWLDALVPA
ncbi:MAG: KamA family radical SAM protein [Coriobacteriia bacterium]